MPTTLLDTITRQARRLEGGATAFPHQFAFVLDNPIRRRLSHPRHIVDSFGLTGSEHVLELGPGPGFFSAEIARRLTSGRLELFDLQPEMLDKARRKLDDAGCRNVGFHAGEASAGLPFPDSAFDVAFLASVIGEVPDRTACVRSLGRVVKSGGSLVFFERFPDPDRLSVHELREIAEPEGFDFVETSGNIWHDVARFRRAS
jgi:ubiquinone/menaquinone biosynthesis C-methylase UbiE